MTKQAIHSTAIISPKAEIGVDVEIGPYSVISDNATIGDGCRLGPHVTIMEYARLGAGCEVHSGAVLGDTPQDLGFKGVESFVEIGDKCVIRECVTIHRGTEEGTVTKVGSGCFLMACAHVAHNCTLGNNVIMANCSVLAGHVHIGERVFLSGGTAVHQFVRIGRLSMLGGNSACSKDVPPFCTVEPCGLNGVKGLNVVGMRRSGMDAAQRQDVKRAFKLLYASGLNVQQALEQIDLLESDVAREMSEFVRTSKRGICGSALSIG